MGLAWNLRCVLALGFLLSGFVMPSDLSAQNDTQKKAKEEPKDKSGVEWTPLLEVTAKAPAIAGATYVASKEFTVTERALRFKVKLTSNEGKGGNMVITLYKLGKPVRKIPIMKHNRDGEKEVAIPVEPGEYKIEISVNNVNATATIEEGKKSK